MRLKELVPPIALSLLRTVSTQVRINRNMLSSSDSDSLPASPSEDNFAHLQLGKTKQKCCFIGSFATNRTGFRQAG